MQAMTIRPRPCVAFLPFPLHQFAIKCRTFLTRTAGSRLVKTRDSVLTDTLALRA